MPAAVCEHGKVGNDRCDDCYIEFGVIQERAAVVAWLRDELDRWGAKQRIVEARGSRAHARELSAIVSAIVYAADAIERGEHTGAKPHE